jgi:Helix-turn-helix domain
MPGNAQLGAVLRDLRKARSLTLATVARQAGCAESFVSYVESGSRKLHPWLAAQLDDIYRTGGVVAALMRGADHMFNGGS